MVNQGLWGAIEQYWTVEPKPRLSRRNSYFDDHQITNYQALKFGLVFSSITILIVALAMLGVMLI